MITPKMIAAVTAFVAVTFLNLVWIGVWAFPFKWAWNCALVPVAKLPPIGYSQAASLLVLCWIVPEAVRGVTLSAELKDPAPPPRAR